jgi:hypothetical protein
MTLSIASQVVRSWGDGWEESVLPLLRQQHSNKSSAGGSGSALSTVEERIIGAGLKALKGEDADAIKELFAMFVVTQEDCVHLMPVIELLLWRSCCAPDSSSGDDLDMRLKVRQWTQMLVDHSLLLGSFTKGVHLHDIVLTYLRNTHSPSELRALQKRVVEELVRASTVRPFEDTGSTAKRLSLGRRSTGTHQALSTKSLLLGFTFFLSLFSRPLIRSWRIYLPRIRGLEKSDKQICKPQKATFCREGPTCNTGSFHIRQSMDRSVPVTENEDVAQWMMLNDSVLFQQTALALIRRGGAGVVGCSLHRQEPVGEGSESTMGCVLHKRQSIVGDDGRCM